MKYAFLHKNFQALTFELRVIFLAHLANVILCFTPWFYAAPGYDEPFYNNAFQGVGFLIGTFIFLLSLSVVGLFVNRLCEYHKIKKWYIPESHFYFLVGLLQILLLILMWSVLFYVSREYEVSEIRFGFFATFLAQIAGLTAAGLNIKSEKKKNVQSFFHNPPLDHSTDEKK